MTFLLLSLSALASNVDTIIENVSKKYEQVSTIEASFTQETTNAFINVPFIQEGKLSLKAPGSMHWTIRAPAEKHFISDGKQLFVWTPGLNQVLKTRDLQGLDLTNIFSDLSVLKEKYLVKLLSEDNNKFHLSLRIKSEAIAEQALGPIGQEIELWFNRENLLLSDVLIKNDGADTRIRLKNIILNPKISDDTFIFVPPKGAEVIDTSLTNIK